MSILILGENVASRSEWRIFPHPQPNNATDLDQLLYLTEGKRISKSP